VTPFTRHKGRAIRLPFNNIDTDQIIPSREMKTTGKTGLKDGLFAGWRYSEGRTPDPAFALNKHPDASIIISGQNFGCGSSREHAVWALKEYGFRAILAESFGDIFYKNCVNNGLAAISLPPDVLATLDDLVEIDLAELRLTSGTFSYAFTFAPADRERLLKGLDMIALTQEQGEEIETFESQDRTARPWAYL
jgi:3-isopropylmalate/(R)-2-methylmalate dehydratase small subunit